MQAKQIRSRHFRSSVGTLLNENYGTAPSPKATSRITHHRTRLPAGTGNDTTPPTRSFHKHVTPCDGTPSYNDHNVPECGLIERNRSSDGSEERYSRNDSFRDELHSGRLASENLTPHDRLSVRSKRSDVSNDRTSTTANSSRSKLLSVMSTLESIKSGSYHERPTSETSDSTITEHSTASVLQDNTLKHSTASVLQDNTLKPCTPFSDAPCGAENRDRRYLPFDFRGEIFRTDVIPPPRYYDAYADAMGLKSRSASKGVLSRDHSCHSSREIEWPPINRPVASRPASSGRNSPKATHSIASRLRSACGVDQDVMNQDIATGLKSSGIRREDSVSSKSSSASRMPFRFQRFGQRDEGHLQPINRHSLGERENSALSFRKTSALTCSNTDSSRRHISDMEEHEEWYFGQTPSHTPTPDYTLPHHPSKRWTKHYSPTRIRHFLRATAEATRKQTQYKY